MATNQRTPEPKFGKGKAIPAVHETTTSTMEFMPGLYADIHAPILPGPYPVITLTHGGGWISGNRTQLTSLAEYLAAWGMVAINADYRPLSAERHILPLVQEVACLGAAAPLLAQPHLTEKVGPVWMLGYSSGAHLTALASLSNDILPWSCPHEPSQIVGMVGLAGPYEVDHVWHEATLATKLPEGAEWLQGKERLFGEIMAGALKAIVPENLWHFLDPIDMSVNHSPMGFLLLAGGADDFAPPFHSQNFADALTEAGHKASWDVIPDADHLALKRPHVVGERIVSFLQSVH